ncbi:ABC transporter substrate-binding protein [Paenibacillus sp. GCM10012307]|uniref:Extracellular solute-binding protein n=1 Tax=Paenibacillus roseus TaxID=2798579 RepID=A0A934J5F1_9BACL|nr:extracellular solute-binding protein [Paenibacillus roseus]MBJ6362029.1 extracellular solute-binding protein [Paenibacillus roseus]
MRKNMWVTVLVGILALSVILSACSGGSNGNTSSGTGAKEQTTDKTSAQVVKLKIWGGVPEENGPGDVVANWNANNPEVQVEYVRYVNDDSGNTKLDTALISQTNAPDIFISYGETYFNRRMNAGMTASLDELIQKAGFDVDAVIGNDNVIRQDGQIFYLPAMKQISMVLFNETALTAAGEPLPTDWTWDDYVALAGKLTNNGVFGSFIEAPGEILPKILLTLKQPQDSYYDAEGLSSFGSDAVEKGMQLQKQLYDEKSMVSWPESISSNLKPYSELFTGQANMILGGTHLMRYVKNTQEFPREFKVAFAPNPQYAKGEKVNIAGFNDLISINSNSAHKEEAMSFISWYLTEGNTAMIPGGRIPTNKQADMDEVVELFVGEAEDFINVESLKQVLSIDYVFPKQVKSVAYAELTKILTEESEKYMMNAQSLEQAMEKVKARADQAIQAESK